MEGPVSDLIPNPTRILFFTGKGGVGKTSLACATAIQLADLGRQVLLVSTDPASNLDEVLGVRLTAEPSEIPAVPGLSALNINPEEAAAAYRERVVGPYRGVLPDAALVSMEEQLSGACTVEIAAFDEFSKLLGDLQTTRTFDHVVFDTAPTGHTLRLLELPAAWSSFIDENVGGTSCLGPLSGLSAQRDLYAASNEALRDPTRTTLVLVSRPEEPSLREAERTRAELAELGVSNVHLILNGIFMAGDPTDATAVAMEARGREALGATPEGLDRLPTTEIPLLPFELVGPESLRRLGRAGDEDGSGAGSPARHPPARHTSTRKPANREEPSPVAVPSETVGPDRASETMENLVDDLAARGRGVVMTMGKGGVGKTTVAARIALALAGRGLPVTLTTTDPAAHVEAAARAMGIPASADTHGPDLRIERIDPALETRRYSDEVMATAGKDLDEKGRALLQEELRSPCTEEIAVFRAFAETVDGGRDRFMVIDTAPTGHTLLLLDSAEAYHREVLRKPSGNPDAVKALLPRLRDPAYTEVLLVTLPESTPIHEAMHLEEDLVRAGITPSTWVVNQSLTPLTVTDPVLRARRASEAHHLRELNQHASRVIVEPWAEARQQVMLEEELAPVPGR